jgi:hypothetical protein
MFLEGGRISMKIRIMAIMLFIFAILAAIMIVEGGNVRYTFDKEAVAAKNAADSAILAKEMERAHEIERAKEPKTIEVAESPYIKITTTASAYDKIDKITAEPGYNNLKINPGDFSVKINNSTIYQNSVAWYSLKSIRRTYLTNALQPQASDPISRVGGYYLQDGNIRKGSLLFDEVPLNIENYEFMWGLADSYNTTIDGVNFGKDSTT